MKKLGDGSPWGISHHSMCGVHLLVVSQGCCHSKCWIYVWSNQRMDGQVGLEVMLAA